MYIKGWIFFCSCCVMSSWSKTTSKSYVTKGDLMQQPLLQFIRWILPFKWNMYQTTRIFVAGEIKQKLKWRVFLRHPVWCDKSTAYYLVFEPVVLNTIAHTTRKISMEFPLTDFSLKIYENWYCKWECVNIFVGLEWQKEKSQKTHELPDKLKPPDGIFCVVYYTTTHRGGNV